MPSDPESGFLPAMPSSRATSARHNKPRAQDLDESLQLTERMKEHVENLIAKEKDILGKMKDNKGAVAKLRDQINSMQAQLEAVQTDRETSTKATKDLQGQIEKLENEHAVLHATHTWTKSSLDSALAAQEEYRKGYNSLRAAFKKAKEDLDKVNDDIGGNESAKQELNRARDDFDKQKAYWTKELDAVNATMQRIARQHKDKSKSVLTRMLQDQASTLKSQCFNDWVQVLKDWQHSEKAKAEVDAVKDKLGEFQKQKSEEARAFLSRMVEASDSGLMGLAFKSWTGFCSETFKERKEAEKVSELLKKQKTDARKKLEATLGQNLMGLQGIVFKGWAKTYKEEKEERQLKAEADKVMKEYQRKKRGQSFQVVERMANKKEQGVLGHSLLVWKIIVNCEIATRYREEEARKRMSTITQEIEKLQQSISEKKEELDDAQEELAEVQKKNKVMRDQLNTIMDLEERMEEIQKEADVEDDS